MKYIVSQDNDRQFVLVVATGVISSEKAKAMIIAAGNAVRAHGCSRCFFDLEQTIVDPDQTMMGMYYLVDVFKAAFMDSSVRIAALYVHDAQHRLYLEEVLALEGFALKHFTDRATALFWLCEN